MKVKFILNGRGVEAETEVHRRLLDLLRDDFGLTGTKEGCGVGECGACTVLKDGRAVNACLVFAGQINGAEVLTIEGMESREGLHPLQESFLEHGAVQCGFCTPGMIMTAYDLVSQNTNPSEEEIKRHIAGNLCRCTGYKQIVAAIRSYTKNNLEGDWRPLKE